MKIGIYVGEIPPPHFINQFVYNLAKSKNMVFVYGSLVEKKFKYNIPSILLRAKPENRVKIFFSSILLIIKLVYNNANSTFPLLTQIWRNEKKIGAFIKRCCVVLPPLLDNLDIFHIQWAKTLVSFTEFIEHLQCPVVLSLRGSHINYSPLADNNLAQGYRKYFPFVTRFHAVSNAIAIEAEKYGASPQKITVIRPSIKGELISIVPLRKMNSINKLLKIISIGRCHWIKGYTYALDAMAILKNDGLSFHYTIIASGKDYENLHYQIHDLGLSKCVSFVNGLPHKEVIEHLSRSDLFILPSIGEGISNAVLEAMGIGIPVISTDCGGMPEIIKDEENGFIVPVRNPKAIVNAIYKFINMKYDVKERLINLAKEKIRLDHNLSDQVTKMLNLYNKII